jgi:indolepyruvate ferredoxin oxidoreductase, beta subunit
MNKSVNQQLVISGVGGQGVLFVTRLLAEAAVDKGFSVLTSETHGMAQRGGSVMSHLKVGGYRSPLIRPGRADGLLSFKSETSAHHAGYLKSDGWTVTNRKAGLGSHADPNTFCLDADHLALNAGFPQSANLVLLGFAIACLDRVVPSARLFCAMADVEAVLARSIRNPQMIDAAQEALRLGYGVPALT